MTNSKKIAIILQLSFLICKRRGFNMEIRYLNSLRLLGVSILVLSLFSCTGSRKAVKDSELFSRENQFQILLQNVKSNPDDPEVHYQLAKAYFDIDSLNLALDAVNKSIELDETNNRAKLLKGNIFLKKKDIKNAYQLYLEILRSQNGDEFVEDIRNSYGKPYPIHQLTKGEYNNAFPCFSPDDQRIVFQSDRDGNWNIYLMNFDGSREVRLTNNLAQDEMPVFSSKDNIIAFTSTRDDTSKKSRVEKSRNIFLMDLENGNVAREISHEADDWYPALSNSRYELAFVSERDDQRDVPFQERFSDIYLKNIRKSTLIRLTQNEADDGSPAFSSDGKWLIFTSNRDGNFQIYKMDTRGMAVEKLTELNGNCGAPHFSHDGRKITFFADIFGNYDIFMMDYNGENIIQLTNHPAQDAYPSFSSDKRKIVFHSNRSGKYQIYWIDLMTPLNQVDLIQELEDKIYSLE